MPAAWHHRWLRHPGLLRISNRDRLIPVLSSDRLTTFDSPLDIPVALIALHFNELTATLTSGTGYVGMLPDLEADTWIFGSLFRNYDYVSWKKAPASEETCNFVARDHCSRIISADILLHLTTSAP